MAQIGVKQLRHGWGGRGKGDKNVLKLKHLQGQGKSTGPCLLPTQHRDFKHTGLAREAQQVPGTAEMLFHKWNINRDGAAKASPLCSAFSDRLELLPVDKIYPEHSEGNLLIFFLAVCDG